MGRMSRGGFFSCFSSPATRTSTLSNPSTPHPCALTAPPSPHEPSQRATSCVDCSAQIDHQLGEQEAPGHVDHATPHQAPHAMKASETSAAYDDDGASPRIIAITEQPLLLPSAGGDDGGRSVAACSGAQAGQHSLRSTAAGDDLMISAEMMKVAPVAMLCVDASSDDGGGMIVMQNQASKRMYRAGAQLPRTGFMAELCCGHQGLSEKLEDELSCCGRFETEMHIKSAVLRAAMGLSPAASNARPVVHQVVVQLLHSAATATATATAAAAASVDGNGVSAQPPLGSRRLLLVTQIDVTQANLQAGFLHEILPRQVMDHLIKGRESMFELYSAGSNVSQQDCVPGNRALSQTSYSDAAGLGGLQETADFHDFDFLMATNGSKVWLTDATARRCATSHPEVSILFADIVGFTNLCQEVTPDEIMHFLNKLFSCWDDLADLFGVYKVETVGDCYMVAGGLFDDSKNIGGYDPDHAAKVLAFGMAMVQSAMLVMNPLGERVKIRVGIHSGPCVSGVVGQRLPHFCLFGDTINTASRMESHCPRPNIVHVSRSVRDMLPEQPWKSTGGMEVKGKGHMETFWMEPRSPPSQTCSSAGSSCHKMSSARFFLQEVVNNSNFSSALHPAWTSMQRLVQTATPLDILIQADKAAANPDEGGAADQENPPSYSSSPQQLVSAFALAASNNIPIMQPPQAIRLKQPSALSRLKSESPKIALKDELLRTESRSWTTLLSDNPDMVGSRVRGVLSRLGSQDEM